MNGRFCVLFGGAAALGFMVFIGCTNVGGNIGSSNGTPSDSQLAATKIVGALAALPECKETEKCKLESFCSGALVDDPELAPEPVFLTAAHCLDGAPVDKVFVVLPFQSATLRPARFVVHSDYNYSAKDDIAVVLFDSGDLESVKKLSVGTIVKKVPDVGLSPELERDLLSRQVINQDGLTRSTHDIDLSVFDSNPDIYTIGFGIDNVTFGMGISRVDAADQEECEQKNIEGEKITVSWDEKTGACLTEFETRNLIDSRSSTLEARTVRNKLVGMLDFEQDRFSSSGDTIVIAPPADQTDSSPCHGDSGGPMFLNLNKAEVFATISGPRLGKNDQGSVICRGNVSTHPISIRSLATLREQIVSRIQERDAEVRIRSSGPEAKSIQK